MAIPSEILNIERPKNTRVKAGPNGTYYVIARTCEYKDGRNVPKELGTIGKIIDGKYVPNPKRKDESIDIKNYGPVALFHKVGSSLLTELISIFDFKDGERLYCLAILRAIESEIRNRDIQTEYLCSYLAPLGGFISTSNFILKISSLLIPKEKSSLA